MAEAFSKPPFEAEFLFTKLLLMDKRNAFRKPLEAAMLCVPEENRSGVLDGPEGRKRRYSVYSNKAEFQRWA